MLILFEVNAARGSTYLNCCIPTACPSFSSFLFQAIIVSRLQYALPVWSWFL